MKTSVYLVGLLLLTSCATSGNYDGERLKSLPRNEIPMYGGGEFSPEEAASNEKFVQSVLSTPMTVDEAYRYSLARGWENYYKSDLSTSMKRFNQAWLFRADDYEVYWGFGLVLGARQQFTESLEFLDRAYGMYDGNNKLVTDLAYGYTIMGYSAKEQSQFYYEKALELFKKSENLDSKYGLNYYDWSVLLFYMEKYTEAKEKLMVARSVGFQDEQPMYRNELDRAIRKEERRKQGLLY